MAGHKVSVTVDGKKWSAIKVVCGLSTQKDKNGKPLLESFGTRVRVWTDISDQKNFPFATLSSMFELSNVVTSDKFKDMKVEYWKEDKAGGDVICSMQFKGWIGKFETYNPDATIDQTGSSENGGAHGGLGAYNNILYLELEPIIDLDRHAGLKLTN